MSRLIRMAGVAILLLAPFGATAADPPPAAGRTMRVVVLDADGKPLADANVKASIWTEEKDFKANRDYKSDAAGAAAVELPKSYSTVRLWANKKPLVGMWAGWEQAELAGGKGMPAEYTFRLESAVAAGGRIVDEQGRPIAGAKVEVSLASGSNKPANGDGRARYDSWLASGTDAASTDAEGRWRIDNVPNDPQLQLSLCVFHPEYVSDQHWRSNLKADGLTTAMFRSQTATMKLKRGVIISGRVTDPDGKPIKDAIVIHGDRPYSTKRSSKFPTDSDGRYVLPALTPEQTTLTVMAAGFAPQMRKLDLQAGLPPQDFQMQPGKAIRLRVVDATGKPVPKASVYITQWKGSEAIETNHNPNHPKLPDTRIPWQTDANGDWEWTAAPDGPVKLKIWSKGSTGTELEIARGSSVRIVTLRGEHRITGAVTDATTGKPIPSFTVVQMDVFHKDWLSAERNYGVAGKNGGLDFLADRTDIPLRLRIEAMGYRSQTGPEFRVGDDTPRSQDFRLQPSEPITGTVLGPDGRPATKAEVVLGTPTDVPHFREDFAFQDGCHRSFTDASGRFFFPDPGEPCLVLARTDDGLAQIDIPAGRHDAGTLRLRPWASVRGQFRDGGRSIAGATVFCQPIQIFGLDRARIQVDTQTVTGPDGRFEFRRVPPGSVAVRVYLGPWRDQGYRSGPHVPLDLKPGEKVELDLGGTGATVTGRVTLTGKVPAGLDCTYSLNTLVRREPGITPPPEVAKLGFDIRNGWRDTWSQSVEGQAYVATLRSWFVKLAPDGTFRISGVPAGEYDLSVGVYAKPEG